MRGCARHGNPKTSRVPRRQLDDTPLRQHGGSEQFQGSTRLTVSFSKALSTNTEENRGTQGWRITTDGQRDQMQSENTHAWVHCGNQTLEHQWKQQPRIHSTIHGGTSLVPKRGRQNPPEFELSELAINCHSALHRRILGWSELSVAHRAQLPAKRGVQEREPCRAGGGRRAHTEVSREFGWKKPG